MMPDGSRFVSLARYVDRGDLSLDDFAIADQALPPLGDGEVLVRPVAFSVDPYMRCCMTGSSNYSWGLPHFEIGKPIHSMGIGRIEDSRNAIYRPGELVEGAFDWADRTVWRAESDVLGQGLLRPLDPIIAKPTHALGVLGYGGLTAYYGIVDVARPDPGETILISGAAGSVGSIAGQVARLLGIRVVGLAGTNEKCRILTDRLRFDAAINYRSPTLEDDIRALMPNGPDVYFDNVGGALSQRIMWLMRRRARVIECGQIASYGDGDGGYKVAVHPIHTRGLRWEGFNAMSYFAVATAAIAQLARWIASGEMIVLETERHGLDALPGAMVGIMRGENIGKMVVSLT